MSERLPTTLGEICDGDRGIQTGPFGSQLHAEEYSDEGLPVVMPQDLGNNTINTAQIARVPEHVAARLARHQLRAGDIVFSRRGDVTRRALVGESNVGWLCGTGCLRARPGGSVDSRFLSYLLGTAEVRDWLNGNAVGTNMLNLNTTILGRLPLLIPGLPEQQAIAEVLGALDDKIAANTALATKSLELADRLFPRESPESSTRLGDVVSVVNGNSYKSADLGPSDHALVTLKSITRDGRYAVEGLKQFAGRYKPEQVISSGEIVVAKTDLTHAAEVVGRAVRVPANDDHTLVASLDLAIVRPLSGIDRTYLLGLLRQSQFREYCRINTTGTTVLHLRSGAIEEFTVQLASSEVQEDYARVAAPLQQAADSVIAENRTLAATRDALLPQLMSGKLRVREAEQTVSGVV